MDKLKLGYSIQLSKLLDSLLQHNRASLIKSKLSWIYKGE